MFRDKYKDGFEDGCEIAVEKSRKRERQLRKENEEIKKDMEALGRSLGGNGLKKMIVDFFSKREKRIMVPEQFDIKIVHENDAVYADNIRKSLNGYGNSTFCVREKNYKSQMTNTADYTILIGNIGKEVSGKKKIILDKYGCYLAASEHQIVLMNQPDKAGARNSFLEFYKKTVKTELNYGEQAEDVKKILAYRDREEKKEKTVAFLEKLGDEIEKTTDKITDKSRALGLVFAICCLPAAVTIGLGAIPVGISEALYNEVRQKLNDSKYDQEMIPLAQKQILQIELCNYIKEQQIKYARAR